MGILVAGSLAAPAQLPVSSASSAQAAQAAQATTSAPVGDAVTVSNSFAATVTGGKLHGVVKSGSAPLPGVTVTAQNTLTGKRVSTTTDITGAWSLNLVQNGRYVIRTQFAAFAMGSQEAVLNAASHDQTVNFDLMLASRAAELAKQQDQTSQRQTTQAAEAIQQLVGSGTQNLSLMSALNSDTETQATNTGATGATLPSIAGNSEFGGDSVSVSGQSGTVSPLAGVDMDRLRDAIDSVRAQGGLGGQAGNFSGGAGLFGAGGFGGGSFGGGGFSGGGRGNFRNFNPGQPHGSVFWMGSNSALDAEPFSLRGQSQEQPASGTNRFGITFMSAPYLPGVTKPSGKDTVFLTLSGTRSSNPLDEYATVPTDAERAGAIPGLATPIVPVSQAAALLKYFPEPNLPGTTQNYHLLSTAQSNSTQFGARYMRSLGKNATLVGAGRGGSGGSGRRSQTQGLRQSINFNYNWSDSASDNVNLFPELGGKSSSASNSLQAGYTVGYHKITSIFNLNWNRSTSQTTNFFTQGNDIATQIGILGPDGGALNANPLNYGLPNVTLSNFTGLNQQQPSFSTSQTISASETLSWIHGKHNLRFGGDYRRVHRDFLGGSNSTGSFYFTGAYTGSSLGDFLLGEPQETTIDAAAAKSYLRENVMDMYAQDDWRVRSNLTLNFGLRYEYFAPYTEKYGHLAFVDTNAAGGFTETGEVQAGGVGISSGRLPDSLVYPYRTAFSPRLGLALRLAKQTVVRAGYGMNYTNSQYASFASTMARQPMANDPSFVNEQTNEAKAVGAITLANGFGTPNSMGSYALDPHYRLPYVQVWNLDVQKTLHWGVVMNLGYNGSKGSNLDITSAPRATASSPNTDPANLIFNYEQAGAFSKFNAGTLRLNKRMSGGIALGANYQYSHSIDDAGSVGGTSTVVAQNWQNLAAEEGNSSFDQRHKVSGTYLYELPFGKDKQWLTAGTAAHILEGFSVSGSFTFASGTSLTPRYQAAVSDVANGTAGTLRPDRVAGTSIAAGGGSLKQWFNTAAFVKPAGAYGTASRNSIPGPGTVQNNMTLSKTISMGDIRSMELRATANNVFNTVQYSGVDTSVDSLTFGQVTSAASMRSFQFTARFRF
jgi:predicted hotdog family 3-hydroxylacyl-ACP dehydratase